MVPHLQAYLTKPLPCLAHSPHCRALYYLLLRSAPIIGLWRLVGEGPVGALIAFTWTQEAIKGEELTFDSLGDEMDCTTYRTLCPRWGSCHRFAAAGSCIHGLCTASDPAPLLLRCMHAGW